jgi:hypothetical protein
VVNAHFTDGSEDTVSGSDCTASPTTLDTVGSQNVTITYNGKTTTCTVTVYPPWDMVILTGGQTLICAQLRNCHTMGMDGELKTFEELLRLMPSGWEQKAPFAHRGGVGIRGPGRHAN